MITGEQTPTGSNESWDMSGIEFNKYDAFEDMKSRCEDYNTTEIQFTQYVARLDEKKQLAANGAVAEMTPEEAMRRYKVTLRHYEEDAALDWKLIQKARGELSGERRGIDMYTLADEQAIGKVEPGETIEAASSIFYEERMAALQQQIEAGNFGEQGETDMKTLKQTWRVVLQYIDAKVDYDLLHEDPVSYQNARRLSHNGMIRQLNALNDLARQYGTTPFTLRNFMTNDFHYESRRDKRGRLNHRAEYDRESVLAYFRSAFKGSFESAERRANNRERLLGRYY